MARRRGACTSCVGAALVVTCALRSCQVGSWHAAFTAWSGAHLPFGRRVDGGRGCYTAAGVGSAQLAVDAATHEDATEDELENLAAWGRDLKRYVRAVSPRAEDVPAKEEMIATVQAAAQNVTGPNALLLPFGSCVTGCGEAKSDLDLVLYVPPDERPAGRNEDVAIRLLTALGRRMEEIGYTVSSVVAYAKVPVIYAVGPNGQKLDISYASLASQWCSSLLREYMTLSPKLRYLAMAIKRWTKFEGLWGHKKFWLSSYAWISMIIFYAQLHHEVPSLQALHRKRASEKAEASGKRSEPMPEDLGPGRYELQFLKARQVPDRKRLQNRKDDLEDDVELGSWLLGFFRFYALEFDWFFDVVSVRHGQPRRIEDFGKLRDSLLSTRAGGLHVEHPLQPGQNLNNALMTKSLGPLHTGMDFAYQHLKRGGSVEKLLGLQPGFYEQAELVPQKGRARASKNAMLGYLKQTVKYQKLPIRCGACGKILKYGFALAHEADCKAANLQTGMALVHESSSKKELKACSCCLAVFSSDADLRRHEKETGHRRPFFRRGSGDNDGETAKAEETKQLDQAKHLLHLLNKERLLDRASMENWRYIHASEREQLTEAEAVLAEHDMEQEAMEADARAPREAAALAPLADDRSPAKRNASSAPPPPDFSDHKRPWELVADNPVLDPAGPLAYS